MEAGPEVGGKSGLASSVKKHGSDFAQVSEPRARISLVNSTV